MAPLMILEIHTLSAYPDELIVWTIQERGYHVDSFLCMHRVSTKTGKLVENLKVFPPTKRRAV